MFGIHSKVALVESSSMRTMVGVGHEESEVAVWKLMKSHWEVVETVSPGHEAVTTAV